MNLSDVITVLTVSFLLIVSLFIIKNYLKKISEGCCGIENGKKIKRHKILDKNKAHYPYKVLLTVDGMVCGNCSAKIENSLNEIDGVWAMANISEKTVTVLMKTPVDEDIIRNKVNIFDEYTVMDIKYL